MTAFMERPGLDEYDCWSYLDAALSSHDVVSVTPEGHLSIDGAPNYGHFNDTGDLCREHAWAVAREAGFVGPETHMTAYQHGLRFTPEELMVRRDESGRIVEVATHSYGRADFDPGEERTAPCEVCGVETLIDTLA